MRSFNTATDPAERIQAALTGRNEDQLQAAETVVREIIDAVRARGDAALVDCTRRFDWPDATADTLEIHYPDLAAANDALDYEIAQVLLRAASSIRDFHEAERGHLQSWIQMSPDQPGRMLGQKLQPVERVGIYVPGGRAAYPSTVLMTAIPARVAGVKEVILCTPPDRHGQVPPLVAATAAFHANRVFKIGGAQAIAAMAYGTDTVPRVDLIVGPGNQYVNIAKRLVYGTVGLDMLAGPSEVAIVADDRANAALVAADLLAQTEHGPDNRGVLLSPSSGLLEQAAGEMERQRTRLERREILEQSGAQLIFVKTQTLEEAIHWSNILAPEHLELMVQEPLAILPLVQNAGCVLLGEHTSAPAGDYLAGPSHTLPTAGAARFSSCLSVATFLKRTSLIYYSREAAQGAAEDISRFAQAEGFGAHAQAARLRGRPGDWQ